MSIPFAQPAGLKFRGKGYKFTALPNQSTEFYIQVEYPCIINGGEFSAEDSSGDQITLEVVDKNNSMNLFPQLGQVDISLDKFLDKWYMSERQFTKIELPYVARLVSPLHIKVTYFNSKNVEKECKMNIFMHKTKEQFTIQEILSSGE